MRRPLVLVLAAALLAAACNSGDDAPPSSSAPGSTDDVDGAPEGPVEGGTLRIGITRPAALDPSGLLPSAAGDLVLADLFYDGLVDMGADGEAEPALAASYDADDDFTTWTFTLAPDAAFAGGRDIVAGDVKASIERVAAVGSASLQALRLETLEGFDAFVSGDAEEISGITAPDDDTVAFTFAESFASFPELLASPLYGIVAVETLEGPRANVDPTPLGSGDFAISNPEVDLFVLDRRSDTDGFVDGIELHLFDDATDAYEAFEAGDLDWAPVPVEALGDATADHGTDGFVPFHAVLFFGFNLADDDLKNGQLRKAVALAIDGDAIVEAVYGDAAMGIDQVVPPQLSGAAENPCATRCVHDSAAAEATLAKAFPDGEVPTVNIDVDDSDRLTAVAAIIQDDLDAVGIPSEVRSRPFAEYQEFAVSGSQELFSFGWINVSGTAESTLDPLFRSQSRDNVTGFVNAEADFLLGAVRAEADPATRIDGLAQVEKLVLSKVPLVPIAQFRTLTVIADRVNDLEIGLDGTFDPAKVWLADA